MDLKNGWIRIDRGKTRVSALIPLSRKCREALIECRRKRVISEFVFVTESLRPYSANTIQRYFQRAKAIAGIDRKFRFHDLRHTFGSNLASAGVSLQVIARCLGHSTTKMAERYARPSEESLRAVVSALDQEFKSSSIPGLKTNQDDSG